MIQVKRVDEINDSIGEFINREFTVFGQESGVEHSVKYDGNKSSVVVDGVKNKNFLDVVNSMAEWAAKVQIKAAQMREQTNRAVGEAR